MQYWHHFYKNVLSLAWKNLGFFTRIFTVYTFVFSFHVVHLPGSIESSRRLKISP